MPGCQAAPFGSGVPTRRSQRILRALAAIAASLILAAPASAGQHTGSHSGCTVLFTQAQHRAYARAVYERPRIRPAARQRLRTMRGCQHSPAAHTATQRLELHLLHQRRFHQRIAAMGIKGIAYEILYARHAVDQFQCLDWVITKESGWDPHAVNKSSGAAGLGQELDHGYVNLDDPRSQLVWTIDYMYGRYGSPCSAQAFWIVHHWY